MSGMVHAVSRRGLGVACAVVATLLMAAPAQADGGDCEGREIERPFLPWLDPGQYFRVPDGGFTDGAAGWQLSGGARVVAENEPWYVHGDEDAAAVRLPRGARAETPPVCVGLLDPTVRFFARNAGGLLGTLRVEVLIQDEGEDVLALPIGVVPGLLADGWAPALPMPVLANLVSPTVAFRFTASGLDSAWVIDDVYVDPYGKG